METKIKLLESQKKQLKQKIETINKKLTKLKERPKIGFNYKNRNV